MRGRLVDQKVETWRVIVHDPHPSSATIIKKAKIDKKIVPLIKWLNSFDSVVTWHCCQGEMREKGKNPECKPYVTWTCRTASDVVMILSILGTSAETIISWSNLFPQLLYRTEWPSLDRLLELMSSPDFRKAARQ